MVSRESAEWRVEKRLISLSGEAIVFEDSNTSLTYSLKEQRKKIRDWAKVNLVGKELVLQKSGIKVSFTSSGIKEAINQPHKFIIQKNELIKNIESALQLAEHIKSEPDLTGELNFIYHYFRTRINNEDSFIVVKEIKKEGKFIFYSIVDKIKK